MKSKIAASLLFFCVTGLFAFNHPEIKWKSVTTAHFVIHYYDRTEPAVYAAWKIAEESYDALSALYEYKPREKIQLSLADYDDYANGFAAWTEGSIMIWLTDARFELRGNNTWLRNVINHELAHIVSLEKNAKMQLLDWITGFDYQSPAAQVSLAEPFVTTRFWPNWFAEGTAQLESARRGTDCWDSRRDMLLLDAVAEGKALSLAEMGHFNHNSLGNELVYNQGFSFVKFIEGKIGTPTFIRLWNSGRSVSLVMENFKSLFKDQTGLELDHLYRQWLDSCKVAAAKKRPSLPTPTTVVWNKGTFNYLPKVSADGKWWGWLSSFRDDFGRTDLVIAPYGTTENAITVKWATASWDFSPDSKRAYFIKQRETSDNGSNYNDLYALDLATKRQDRLTRNARLYDIAVSPDNMRIACVKYVNGVFSVVQTDPSGREWETLTQGTLGEPFIGLSFSPVKTASTAPATAHAAGAEYKLVTSKVINGWAQICIIGLESKSVTMIGPNVGQQEFPVWGKDNRIYFDADYDGTFNIYSMKPDGSDLVRHTNSTFGMFQPFLDNNGKIICTQFARQAFSVVTCDATGSLYSPPVNYACPYPPVPKPKGEVTIKSRKYEGKLLRPVWEVQSMMSVVDQQGTVTDAISKNTFASWLDTAQITATTTILMSRSDALGRKGMAFGITGAFVHMGKEIPDTSWNESVSKAMSAPDADHLRYFGFPFNSISESASRRSRSEKPSLSLLNPSPYIQKSSFALAKKAAATNDNPTDSSAALPQWIPFLAPLIGFQNNSHELSLSFNAQLLMALIIPAQLSVGGQAVWHAARDWYFGISPQADISILAFANSQLGVPLWAVWSTYDYLNSDVGYNQSGQTALQVMVAPQFFAYSDSSDKNNIQNPVVSSTTIGLMFSHGIPLTKYSTCLVRTNNYYEILSYDGFKDSQRLLKGLSNQFYSLSGGASFIFPLWRQINKGPAYADALYGEVGYDLTFYSNAEMLPDNFFQAFSDPNVDMVKNRVYVSHVISAGTRLGFFKSYSIPRSLNAKVSWDVMRNRGVFSFVLGF
jgi:hypothetical protein